MSTDSLNICILHMDAYIYMGSIHVQNHVFGCDEIVFGEPSSPREAAPAPGGKNKKDVSIRVSA